MHTQYMTCIESKNEGYGRFIKIAWFSREHNRRKNVCKLNKND